MSDKSSNRSERIQIRCTPEVKLLYKKIKERTGDSAGDLFEITVLNLAEQLGITPHSD